MTKNALGGLRVLDFSWIVAGPMTTKMLAGLGAEVIKVESSLRPEFRSRGNVNPILNNSKKSITVDIRTPGGQDVIRRLASRCDVVVENFSSGVMDKNNIGYEALRAVRPDIIFVSASGMGRTGPQKDLLAYGSLLQAYSGRSTIIGDVNIRLERMGIMPAWTDPVTALWEVTAILAAVRQRKRTGEGCFIDLSMLESTVALLPEAVLREQIAGAPEGPGGNREIEAAPGGCFRCAGDDQWLALSVRTDAEWKVLCGVMGRPDLAADPRFTGRQARRDNRAAVDALVADWLKDQPADRIEALLLAGGVFAARTRTILDLLDDPLLSPRNVFPPLGNGRRTIALPWMDEDGWRGDFTPTAELGEHTESVLRDVLGMEAAEIESLRAANILA